MEPHPQIAEDQGQGHKERPQARTAGAGIDVRLTHLPEVGFDAEAQAAVLADRGWSSVHPPDGEQQSLSLPASLAAATPTVLAGALPTVVHVGRDAHLPPPAFHDVGYTIRRVGVCSSAAGSSRTRLILKPFSRVLASSRRNTTTIDPWRRTQFSGDGLGGSDPVPMAEYRYDEKSNGTGSILTGLFPPCRYAVMPRTTRQAPGGMVFHVLNRDVGRTRLFRRVNAAETPEELDRLRLSRARGGRSARPAGLRTAARLGIESSLPPPARPRKPERRQEGKTIEPSRFVAPGQSRVHGPPSLSRRRGLPG